MRFIRGILIALAVIAFGVTCDYLVYQGVMSIYNSQRIDSNVNRP